MMRIDLTDGILSTDGSESLTVNGVCCCWTGLLWMRGFRAGKESVEHMLQTLAAGGTIPFSDLFGAFSCVVNTMGATLFFTDNSWMNTWYWVPDFAVDTRYLALAHGAPGVAPDRSAIAEFLALGKYLTRLPHAGIGASDARMYYTVEDGCVVPHDKGVGAIEDPSPLKTTQDVVDFFRDMAYALGEIPTLHDLSGGYDSRLSLSLLWTDDSPITIALSSYDPQGDKEIRIASRVARLLGKELAVCRPAPSECDEALVRSLFALTEGTVQTSLKDLYRTSQYLHFGVDCGAGVRLTGDGGVFYKDWDWTHEFPFYNKKKSNIPRYYDMKIGTVSVDLSPFAPETAALVRAVRSDVIEKLQPLTSAVNTQTNDRLYAYRSNTVYARTGTAYGEVLPLYAPLRELIMTQFAFRLPRGQRFYNNFQREVITRCTPQIARVRTYEGTNCSARLWDKILDIVFMVKAWSEKAYRLVSRRLVGRNSLFAKAPDPAAQKMQVPDSLTARALAYARQTGILKPDTADSDVSSSMVLRLLWIYLLFKDSLEPGL